MFTWICPKCGGEVPPAYNDCPRCSPPKPASRETTEPASVPVTPPAREYAPPQYSYAAAPPPQPSVAATPPAVVPPAAAAPVPPPPPAPTIFASTSDPAPERAQYPQNKGMSPALVAILAFGGMVVLLGILYFYVLPGKENRATAATTQTQIEQPGPVGATASSHPLAKHLEVAGVRLEGLKGGQARIQYVVINHSAADLPELNMNVTLQSAGQPMFEFPVKLPSLGPLEVRNLTTTVKTDLKPYELPDWQMLRPQFRIAD